MQPPSPDDAADLHVCPACQVPLATSAVLCVACGYHVKLGRHLATVVERGEVRAQSKIADDRNPYASPSPKALATISDARDPYTTDLTEAGARRAKAIVRDANMLLWAVLMSLLCPFAWFWVWILMFPWYAFRLWQWRQLNAEFSELNQPNSFSPHGDLAGSFQDCQLRLWAGIAIGIVYWAILACGGVLTLLVER